MKALFTTLTVLAATAFVSPATFAADAPGVLAGYNLPIGANLKLGHAVRPVFSESFQKSLQTMLTKISSLPKEKQEAFAATFDVAVLPPFDADVWDKAGYEAYKTGLKETKVEPNQEVAISLQPLGNDEWRLNSVTVDQNKKAAPLTLGALRYNARTNVWVSNNGELKAAPYTTTADCIYGAQKGTEWKLEKADDLSKIVESIRFTKTDDGKFVYISYRFQETTVVSGTAIAQGGYTLRIPLNATGAAAGNQSKH